MSRTRQALEVLQQDVLCGSMSPGYMMETSEDSPLARALQSIICTYNRQLYGGWPQGSSIPNDGEVFSYWGRCYLTAPSNISPNAS